MIPESSKRREDRRRLTRIKKVIISRAGVLHGKYYFSTSDLEKILGLQIKGSYYENGFIIENSTSVLKRFSSKPATMEISSAAPAGMALALSAVRGMPLTPLWWKENNWTVEPYVGEHFDIFYADKGMKFVILVYKLTNVWVESQHVPEIDGYIKTSQGFYYKPFDEFIGSTKRASLVQIEELIGTYHGWKSSLLPQQSVKKWLTFEIPQNATPTEIVLKGVNAAIILKKSH